MHCRLSLAAFVFSFAMPAQAVIVVDGSAANTWWGINDRAAAGLVIHGSDSASRYPINRSHAWQQYQRGRPVTGRPLVVVPLSGALTASSAGQSSVREHIARAQAYRLGDRW